MRVWKLAALSAVAGLSLLAGISNAQSTMPREIAGFARASNTNQPPQGTVIYLESEMGEIIQQISPEGSGSFSFPMLSPQIYYVAARAPGYREVRHRADLLSNRRVSVQLFLPPDGTAPAPQPSPAEAMINERLLRVPEEARKEFERGNRELVEKKNPRKSIGYFEKAAKLFPAFAEAYHRLGTAHMDLGEWKEAQTALEEAIKQEERFPAAHLALGVAYIQQGNFAAAEKPLLRGLEINPGAIEGHYELGRVYWALQRFAEADVHARKTVTLRPEFAAGHILMGNVYLQKRDGQAALIEFRTYLELEPNGPFSAGTRDVVAKLEKVLAARN